MGGTMRSRYRDTASRLTICVTLRLAILRHAEPGGIDYRGRSGGEFCGRRRERVGERHQREIAAGPERKKITSSPAPGEIRDDKLRAATLDAIDNPQTCIRHRIGVDDAAKTRIMASLAAEGLVDPEGRGQVFRAV